MTGLADLADAWAAAAWRAGWQGGLAALVVWSVCRLVPSVPARFQAWLWRLVVLKFAVAFFWAAPIGVPLLPAVEPTAGTLLGSATPDRIAVEGGSVVRHEPAAAVAWRRLGFMVWSAVVAWQAARLLRAFRAAGRLRRGCRPTGSAELLGQAAAVGGAFDLRTPLAVLESDGDGSPMLVGVVRPAVVFPVATLNRLDECERAMVLGHELAHARRGDLLWGLLAAVVRAVFFFHPLAWLAERRLRATQEVAADALAAARLKHAPAGYAALLVSVVGKLGPDRALPAMSAGVAGSHQSLKQRLLAMRFMKPMSRRAAAAHTGALVLLAAFGVVPWAVVAADPPAADKPGQKEATGSGRGKFASFKDGTLTVVTNDGTLLRNKVPETAKVFQWNDVGGFKPVGTADALTGAKAGTWVHVLVEKGTTTVRLGARKAVTTGTFVSFKDNRLLILGKNLGASFVAKYGSNVHFNKFRDAVPAYESVDGGEYKLLGPANKVLGGVKEGAVVFVHGEGDDNITLVQIGAPTKK